MLDMNYKLFFGIVTILHLFQLKKEGCDLNTHSFCNCPEVDVTVICLIGWVNRFANAGDAAMEVAGNTAFRVRCSCFCFSYFPGSYLYPWGHFNIVKFK